MKPQPSASTDVTDTNALIKRAFLFLEDGEFDNAGQYLNQALNQDAEDSRIHFGLLMLEHRVHNADELIGKLATPLEEEKLFQRALRFAQGEYKSQLESYARASHGRYALCVPYRVNHLVHLSPVAWPILPSDRMPFLL